MKYKIKNFNKTTNAVIESLWLAVIDIYKTSIRVGFDYVQLNDSATVHCMNSFAECISICTTLTRLDNSKASMNVADFTVVAMYRVHWRDMFHHKTTSLV